MPIKNTVLNFKHHFKKLPIPFVIYADFECFTKPINSCQPNPKKSFTQGYQKHEPSGYCLYLKGLVGMKDKYKPIVYTKKTEDEDISKKFIKHVRIIAHSIYRKYYLNPKPLEITPQEKKDFDSAKVCHICEQDYISFSKKIKVGEYLSRKKGKIFPIKFEIRFIDSIKFLQTSLANLVSNLQPTDFKNLNRVTQAY